MKVAIMASLLAEGNMKINAGHSAKLELINGQWTIEN